MRNYDRIQFERIRRKLDVVFEALHDELEIAYYQGWKLGISSPWHGFDVLPTPEESKNQFDKLHGAIGHVYLLALNYVNNNDPDGGYEAIDTVALNAARQWLQASGLPVGAIRNFIKTRIDTRMGYSVDIT